MQVEDFSKLDNLSLEKLIKLRDVAWQNYTAALRESEETRNRWGEICCEIQKRKDLEAGNV